MSIGIPSANNIPRERREQVVNMYLISKKSYTMREEEEGEKNREKRRQKIRLRES